MSFGLILLIIAGLLAFYGVGIYNRLIALKNQVKNAWSQIDIQLQRRYDLIPNLVETVKGYMNYEKGTLEAIVKARSEALAAKEAVQRSGGPTEASLKNLSDAEGQLTRSLGSFFALIENYPQLRASENMQQLQEELSSTENKVAFARQAYNDQAMLYNTTQQEFPAVLFATVFGHHPVDLFEVDNPEAKKAVKVSFD